MCPWVVSFYAVDFHERRTLLKICIPGEDVLVIRALDEGTDEHVNGVFRDVDSSLTSFISQTRTSTPSIDSLSMAARLTTIRSSSPRVR